MDSTTMYMLLGFGLLGLSELLALVPNFPTNGILHTLLVVVKSIGTKLVANPSKPVEALTSIMSTIATDDPQPVVIQSRELSFQMPPPPAPLRIEPKIPIEHLNPQYSLRGDPHAAT